MFNINYILMIIGGIVSIILITKKNKIGLFLLAYWIGEGIYNSNLFFFSPIQRILLIMTIVLLCTNIILFSKQFWRKGL